MTFLQLQQELSTVPGARFKSTQSVSYKAWINFAGTKLWNLEDWSFRKNTTSFTVTAGQETATSPTDLGIVLGLWNQYGDKVPYLAPAAFMDSHRQNVYSGATGDPTSFTVVNKTIYLDPTPSSTSSSWQIYYDRCWCHKNAGGTYVAGDMTADTDVPAFPDEVHYLLVYGATSLGSVSMNDFTYQFAEQMWKDGIDGMTRNYLVDQRGAAGAQQWGAAAPVSVWW